MRLGAGLKRRGASRDAKGTQVAVSCGAPPKVLPAGLAKGQTVIVTGKVVGAAKHSLTDGRLGLWLMALAPPVLFEAPVVRIDLADCEVALAPGKG